MSEKKQPTSTSRTSTEKPATSPGPAQTETELTDEELGNIAGGFGGSGSDTLSPTGAPNVTITGPAPGPAPVPTPPIMPTGGSNITM